MSFHVHDRVLHFIYRHLSDVPDVIHRVCDAYEGSITNRIGFNFPLSMVKQVDPRCSLLSYDAEYFIGYQERDIATKRHELQHAKYYMNAAFQQEVKELWNSFPSTYQDKVYTRLLKMKYPNRPDILLDEFQAYYFTEKPNFFGYLRYK